MKKRYFIALAALLTLVFFIQCSPQKHSFLNSSKKNVLRLIDQLDKNNLKTTPFPGIIQNFQFVHEEYREKPQFLSELSTAQQKVWTLPTQHSILSQKENVIPQGMEVFLDKIPVKFMTDEAGKNEVKWNWIETDRSIDFREDEKYMRSYNSMFFDDGEFFFFDAFLPGSPYEIEIMARRNWHPVDMEVFINDELVARENVQIKKEAFLISKDLMPGLYKIKIKATVPEVKMDKEASSPPRLLVSRIHIHTQNDLILYFVPPSQQANFLKGSKEAKFYSDQDASGNKNKYVDLYKIRYDFMTEEFESQKNPEGIKKKILLDDLSLNVLMAPPDTEMDFKLHVLPQSVLEFGIGIFAYQGIEKPRWTRFKILAVQGEHKSVLFEKVFRLKPRNLKDQIVWTRLDLSPYGKKDIHLVLLTENLSKSKNIPLSFWINPVLFQPSSDKPKIILISLDTLRADHLGAYGYARPTSPHIDELAKDSVLFENVYAQSSWTLPSHVSMLFSLNSASHQVYYDNQKIDSALPSVASYLRKFGYSTYAFTGGGYVSNIYGFSNGFDLYDEPVRSNKTPLNAYEAEKLFQHTSKWLDSNKDKAFFLFLHTFQIHGPYFSPAPWNRIFLKEDAPWSKINLKTFFEEKGDRYNFSEEEIANIIGLYDGEIRFTDDSFIGPLISQLKKLGIYENTLIILTSDHGEEFLDHRGWLHGHSLYNELIHVPLLVKFPHSEFKGKRIKAKCREVDIMPTILEAAGVPVKRKSLDGKSLLEFLKDRNPKDRTFISDIAFKDVPDPCPALMATNKGNVKFIITKAANGIKNIETYDLEKDPHEQSKTLFQSLIKLRQDTLKFLDTYYMEKMKKQRAKTEIHLDEKMKEKLRALGYLH